MKSKKNLETSIGFLDNLLSQISPEHPSYDNYIKAVNTAVAAIKAFRSLELKKQNKYRLKKTKSTDAD